MQPQRQARGNEKTDGEEGTADIATDGKATKRATAGEGGRLADGTAGDVAGREADAGASYEGLTVGNEVAGNDAVTGGTRGLTTGKAATDGDAVTGESRGTTVGLADGTPGCEGVCPEGEYDPRFDRKSDQFRKFGFIYKITCLVNGKVYIGQTTRSVRKRWRCHVNEAARKDSDCVNPIDRAIQKYGKNSFLIEPIEKVLIDYLGIREQYWIRHYDCCTLDGYDKGYNASRGGEPNKRYILDEQDIIRTYQMGCSLTWMMFVLQMKSTSPIKSVLMKHGIPTCQKPIYKTSNLPTCIIEAYYRNTGKTKPQRIYRQKGHSQAKEHVSDIHKGIRISAEILDDRQGMSASLVQFDRYAHFIHCVYSYEELVDWLFQSGLTDNSKRSGVEGYVYKQVADNSYTVFRMFRHYWIVLDAGDEITDPQVMSKCQGLIDAYLNEQYAGNMLFFEENIDKIIVDIVNSSIRDVAERMGIQDNTLKKRLLRHGLPHKTWDLFRYAIDNHLIDDPIGDEKKHIYDVFCDTNSLADTMSICDCSKEDVYFACKYYGLSPYAVDNMRKKGKRYPARPIKVYQSDDTYLCTVSSMAEAEKYTGVHHTTVSRSCNHHNIQAPYYFRFADEEEDNMKGEESGDTPPSGGQSSPSEPS